MPDARQNSSKLAEMLARASSFNAPVGMAVDVVSLFMACLSFVGIITPSLVAQGEQRRFPISTSTGTFPVRIRRGNTSDNLRTFLGSIICKRDTKTPKEDNSYHKTQFSLPSA